MSKKLKKIPRFKSENEEREFWLTHDSTEYVDWSKAGNWQFPNLKLTSKPITIRLPQSLINRLKIKAHKMDVPYQSLIKQLLLRGLSSL
jgi:predicted DNA binding CopG/RHH family protein